MLRLKFSSFLKFIFVAEGATRLEKTLQKDSRDRGRVGCIGILRCAQDDGMDGKCKSYSSKSKTSNDWSVSTGWLPSRRGREVRSRGRLRGSSRWRFRSPFARRGAG